MKKIMSILLAIVMLFGITACSSAATKTDAAEENTEAKAEETTATEARKPKNGDKWKIGLSISFTGNAFRSLCLATLEQEIEKRGDCEVTILDGQNDINKQVSDLESLIAMDVDGIMLLPGSSEALEPTLIEARNLGIPVGVFDKEIFNDNAYDFYVGANTAAQAEKLTTWLFEQIGGEGNIIQLGGAPGNSGTAILLDVCNELIETKYPNINILAYKDTNWKEDTSKQTTTDLLLAYPDQIDAIWCDGTQSAAGAIKACLAAGVAPVPTIGNTAYAGMVRLYEENKDTYPDWDVCLGSKPASITADCLNYLIDLLEGKELPGKDICPDPILYDLKECGAELFNPDLPDSMYVDHTLTEENLKKLLENDVFNK